MKSNQAKSYKWAYLPFVFSSAAILASSVTAAPYGSQQYQPAKQVRSINQEYVGGGTQLGISVTDDGNVGLDVNQVISESQNSSTSVGLWGDFDVKGDDKGVLGRGAQINHNWYSGGRVNKVTAAYDRNANGHDKATLGYGQETESMFWEGHVSKGLSDRKSVGNNISDKAYDYGVGGSVGTFLKDSNMRVRAGLDHEWSDDVGAGEKNAKNTTLSAGIEKFFQGTPHSLGLDVAASKKSGGLNKDSDTNVTGRVSYHYDFGGASIYQPDRRYKRVRVEVPGKAVAPRYAQKRTYKRVPTYKTVPTYAKKTIRKPYKQLVKSTMALEGQTFFKLNSARLIPSAQARLKQIAAEIRRNGYKGAIRITGNTCGLGDAAYDQRLSEQRANAVRAFLIRNGFNADHLIARGLGKGHPKYPNTPDQGFKNRRVDIEYVSERQAYKTGYRTETQTVRTGTRRVATGFRNVPAGAKNVLISSGQPGAPRVIWKTVDIPTPPAWIKRALHNNIRHDRNVNTFTSTDPSTRPNTAPNAVNDTNTTGINTPVTINVLGNDSDPEGDNLTITRFDATSANGGTITRGANGQLIYTPRAGFTGTDTFTYTISDGHGGTDTATVTVTVAGGNTAPDAVNDSNTTGINTPVTINVLGNDTDPEGDDLTITRFDATSANGGTITRGPNGRLIYTPRAGFTGTDTFTYTISDGHGGTDTATVTVTVAGGNTAPDAVNDSNTTGINTPVAINVLGNDTDPEGDNLTITSFDATSANGGTVTRGPNGRLIYTPRAGFTGTDTFTYTISDGHGGTDTATVTVTVGGGNTAPDAVNDSNTTGINTPVTINVLGNDTDPEGDNLTITSFDATSANGGTVTRGPNGRLIYTPRAGFTGTDTFTYTISDGHGGTDTATVTVTVGGGNTAPDAVNDSNTTGMNTPVTINVLGNDTDPEGDNLTITSFDATSANGGTVTRGSNGRLIYTPRAGFTGTDTFTYTISDGHGGTDTATVTVTVTGPANQDPDANNDTVSGGMNTPVTINVLGNDTDPEGDNLTITSFDTTSANGGTITRGPNGQLIYTPRNGFTGTDTFTYTISDGHGGTDTATVTVTVAGPANSAPVANNDTAAAGCDAITISVLGNDTDADGDALSIIGLGDPSLGTAVISGNTVIYTPVTSCGDGTDTFSYTISDGHGHQATASITVNVTGSGNCSTGCTDAESDDISTTEGTPVSIPVLANDTGSGLQIKSVDTPDNGTAVITGNTIKYTPNPGFTGTDSFWYGIIDDKGYKTSALILVYVESL